MKAHIRVDLTLPGHISDAQVCSFVQAAIEHSIELVASRFYKKITVDKVEALKEERWPDENQNGG